MAESTDDVRFHVFTIPPFYSSLSRMLLNTAPNAEEWNELMREYQHLRSQAVFVLRLAGLDNHTNVPLIIPEGWGYHGTFTGVHESLI